MNSMAKIFSQGVLGLLWIALMSSSALGQTLPEGAQALRDLAYVPGGHERQKLDLYLPSPEGKHPLVIWVHGGAFRMGSKDPCPALWLLQDGYAVASINYRLSQHALFPAQIEDCKAAVRWLRAHAAQYGLDSNHIGAWGASAGGHLAAMLGTAGAVKEFEKGPNLELSSWVQAVCDWFGPTDFTQMNKFPGRMDHDAADSPESQLIGGPVQENKEKARRANPITYVSREDPPFLIMHGDQDQLVPLNQSELLHAALQKAGVPVTFHVVQGTGHGFQGGPDLNRMVSEFFRKYLN
jgi:acetyl esterase/lipase